MKDFSGPSQRDAAATEFAESRLEYAQDNTASGDTPSKVKSLIARSKALREKSRALNESCSNARAIARDERVNSRRLR